MKMRMFVCFTVDFSSCLFDFKSQNVLILRFSFSLVLVTFSEKKTFFKVVNKTKITEVITDKLNIL